MPPPPPTPYTKESRFRSRERWPCCPSSNLRTNLTPCTTEVQGVPASLGSRPLKSNYQPLKITFKSCRIFRAVPGWWVAKFQGHSVLAAAVEGYIVQPRLSSWWTHHHLSLQTPFLVLIGYKVTKTKKMQHYHCSTNSLMYNPDKDCNCPELKSSLGFFGFSFW